jgi:DNA (cytosine-5)-methyltransferase 1
MTYIPECDIFTWSFPCTDLSKAGKQQGLVKSGNIQEIDKSVFTKKYSFKFFDDMAIGLSQEELYQNIAFYQDEKNDFTINHLVNIEFGISFAEKKELPELMRNEVIKILQNRLLKLEGKDGTRSGLVYEVLRLLKATEIKPKVLIMENVVDLVQELFKAKFYEIQKEIAKLGYENHTMVLNGSDYGVAQNRERVFMVSILGGGRYEFPIKEKLEKRLKDYLEPSVDEKYYLSDETIGKYLDYNKRNADKGNGFAFAPKQPGDVGVVVDTYNKKALDNQDIIGTITSNTGTYGHCGNFSIYNNLRIRKLTPLECWHLMGIDDEDFYKAQSVCSNSQLYKQAGNGIIVDVFAKILQGLIE